MIISVLSHRIIKVSFKSLEKENEQLRKESEQKDQTISSLKKDKARDKRN